MRGFFRREILFWNEFGVEYPPDRGVSSKSDSEPFPKWATPPSNQAGFLRFMFPGRMTLSDLQVFSAGRHLHPFLASHEPARKRNEAEEPACAVRRIWFDRQGMRHGMTPKKPIQLVVSFNRIPKRFIPNTRARSFPAYRTSKLCGPHGASPGRAEATHRTAPSHVKPFVHTSLWCW